MNSLLFKMRAKGVEVVVSEVSAHAIYLKKMCGIVADIAVLTNVTQDHLDFFRTMQNYADVKSSFFCQDNVTNAVVNVDDALGKQIYGKMPSVSYGFDPNCDCFVQNVQTLDGLTTFEMSLFGNRAVVQTKLQGQFNIYNILSNKRNLQFHKFLIF